MNDEMSAMIRSYAEAAYQAGFKTALDAAVGGSLAALHMQEWFDRNPPECAIYEGEMPHDRP